MGNLEFYVTDHSPDKISEAEWLRWLYCDIREGGFGSVRTDWRWNRVFTGRGGGPEQLNRYSRAVERMDSVGLESPTIALSSVPKWAMKIYQRGDKKAFFHSYKLYVIVVARSLETVSEKKISQFQILNELNTELYCKISMEDISELCRITREVLREYNPNIKLMATVFAGNLVSLISPFGLGTDVMSFLKQYREMLTASFDVIGVDYYPGLLHHPWRQRKSFGDIDLLRKVFEEISGWGLKYELSEVGFPTNWPPWKSVEKREKKQCDFYLIFFTALKNLLQEMKDKGRQLPSRIGIYQAIDEEPESFFRRMARAFTFFWEHSMGLIESSGRYKRVFTEFSRERSSLNRIIEELKDLY